MFSESFPESQIFLQMRAIIFLFCLLLVMAACQPKEQASHQATLDDTALHEKIMQMGDSIANSSQQTLAKNLQQAIQRGGVAEAIRFCNLAAMPLTDSLSRTYNVQIKRASLRVRNPKDTPTPQEEEILNDYQQKLAQNHSISPQIHELDEEHLLYTKPILINNALCLNCHGEVGKEVTEEAHALIREKYPNDNATGHQMGELRGMWSVTFSKFSYLLKKDEE